MANPDIAVVRRRWFESLLPFETPDMRAVMDAAREHARRQRPDGTWADIPYADDGRSAWKAVQHLERTHILAKAGALLRAKPRDAAPFQAAALRSLSWWLAKDPQNPNWWWNQIGVPTYLTEILVLLSLGEAANPALLARADKMIARSKPGATGANLVWLSLNPLTRGLLADDPAPVADNYARIYGEIRTVAPGREGLQVDGSFHQHGVQFYSGGYGLAFANDCARFTAFAWGTRFQIPAAAMDALLLYLLDGEQWMIRGRTFDHAAVGREITRAGKVAAPLSFVHGPIAPTGAAYALPQAMHVLANLPGSLPRKTEIAAFANRLHAGDTPRSQQEKTGHRHFWRSDYASHRRDGYLASVRMVSTRTQAAEIVNSEGATLHHVADGAMWLYRNGDEYRDIFPLWDWRRVPGTTAEQDEPPLSKAGAVARRGKTDFVGGVSDGQYGAAAFDFVRDTLRARKAWFFFDDEIVCLGAGIASDSEWPVVTTVNQCWHRRGSSALTGAGAGGAWHFQDGVGYLFPKAGNAAPPRATTEWRTGRWSSIGTGSSAPVSGPVYTLWLDHSRAPRGASYAYVVLPNVTVDVLQTRAGRPDGDPVRIVANTPQVQAVFHAGLTLLQAAFYEPGSITVEGIGKVTADQPCVISARQTGESDVRVAAANPRNLPLRVSLTTDQRLSGPGCSAAPQGGTQVVFDLPAGPTAGASVVRDLQAG